MATQAEGVYLVRYGHSPYQLKLTLSIFWISESEAFFFGFYHSSLYENMSLHTQDADGGSFSAILGASYLFVSFVCVSISSACECSNLTVPQPFPFSFPPTFRVSTSDTAPNYVLSLLHRNQPLHFQIKSQGESWFRIDDGPHFEGLHTV